MYIIYPMEMTLAKKTKAIIEKYDFRIQKRYGQNFLVDEGVLERIIAAAEISKADTVLEIGPGIGTLSGNLAGNAGHLICVEIDKNLIPILEETLSEHENITIINDDILKVDVAKLCEEYNGGQPIKVVANLPYYITTPIIMELLEKRLPIASITVMVQKEVAERMQAAPGGKDYGALSLAVQYYSEARLVCRVPENCFIPRPNVDSAVISLKLYEKPPVEVINPDRMFELIRAAFNQRRKTLVNAISNAVNLGISKEQALEGIKTLGLDENIRGEVLDISQFSRLSDLFFSK